MFLQLTVLSVILAGAAFGCGMLPLTVSFSKSHIERLSALGTGLLLGAGLGVIIPEGVETLIESHSGPANVSHSEIPTHQIALSLLVGFTLMLALEQLVIPNAHHIDFRDRYSSLPSSFRTPQNSTRPTSNGSSLEFDAELEDLERHSTGPPLNTPAPLELGEGGQRSKASALTAGLVIHSLADGLALGVSSLAGTGAVNDVSLVVFLALLLHKAPTALALTTSLLSYNLPRSECKNYVAAFSAATPVSALVSYILFALFGNNGSHNWSGIALLVSGGSFLYVATVLQPVSHSEAEHQDMKPIMRVALIVLGMSIPFTLSSMLGHGH